MTLGDSPSFSDPEVQVKSRDNQDFSGVAQTSASIVLVMLIIGAVLLTLFNLFNTIGISGSVSGVLLDAQGDPIIAEVFVFGQDTFVFSDASGYFKLDDVPSGSYQLIVNYRGFAQPIPVNVQLGRETNLGIMIVDIDLAGS